MALRPVRFSYTAPCDKPICCAEIYVAGQDERRDIWEGKANVHVYDSSSPDETRKKLIGELRTLADVIESAID